MDEQAVLRDFDDFASLELFDVAEVVEAGDRTPRIGIGADQIQAQASAPGPYWGNLQRSRLGRLCIRRRQEILNLQHDQGIPLGDVGRNPRKRWVP